MVNKRSVSLLILISFILIPVLYHVTGYFGHYGYDDIHYARIASDLLNGKADFNDHYLYRLPVVLATALSYKLTGISDFASSLPSIVISALIIILVFCMLKEEKPLTLISGLSLATFSNWFIFYSDKLMPDIYVALSVILSLFILYHYKFKSSKKKTVIYSLLFALSLFFGFLAKETIVLMIPLLLYLVITDFFFRRDIRFWIWTAVFGLSLLFVYFYSVWALTGDFTKRFEAVIQNSYLNHCSYDKQPVVILLKRLLYGFINLSIYQGFFPAYIFIFAFLIQKRERSLFRVDSPFSLFFVSAIILFLSSNFMSVSLTSYVPMCLDPRHYLFLIPVSAIPAAKIFSEFAEDKSCGLFILIVSAFVTVLSWFLPGKSFWLLYAPLLILFTFFYYFRRSLRYRTLFTALFVFVLILTPVDAIIYAGKVSYRKQKEIVVEQLLNRGEKLYVITDEVQKRLGEYFCVFNDKMTSFLSYGKFDFDTLSDCRKLLLLNEHTMYLSNIDYNDLPYYSRNIDSSGNLIFRDKKLNISLYELDGNENFNFHDSLILHSLNGFERFEPYWKQNNDAVTDETFHSGEKSIRAGEFPATFSYPLDSLTLDHIDRLLIKSTVFCNFYNTTDSKLVISIENRDGVYLWESIGIDKYLKAYSIWWPVNFEIFLNTGAIKETSVLKVYLWNKDKQKGWIDDFEVSVVHRQ